MLFCVTKNSVYLNLILRESILDLLLDVDLQLELVRAFWQLERLERTNLASVLDNP